jgi:superfamily I DNA/RNA helicase
MRDLRIDVNKWDKEQEQLPIEQRSPPPGVYLGTCHSTKGAQWKNCYVVMPKGKFPFEPKPRSGDKPRTEEEMQAQVQRERRLAYVALTRPIQNLTVICPSSIEGKSAGVSSFVSEAGLVEGENVKRSSEGMSKEASIDGWSASRGSFAEPFEALEEVL